MKKIILVISSLISLNLFAIPFISQMMNEMQNMVLGNQHPDYERESRIVSQIEDSVLEGEVEKLSLPNGDKFFSIYQESETDKVKGGVIILHNRGYHANWEYVVRPLRVDLAKKGWNTLSIQMPVLNKEAKYYDYLKIMPYARPRIAVAINFLRQQGLEKIIVIGHGCGVHMLMDYIEKYSDSEIDGFVGIGMGATDTGQKMPRPYPLAQMSVPVLDIYGEKDFAGVKRLAIIRKEALDRFGHIKSKQMVVKKADHYYKKPQAEKLLLNKISTWIDTI
ncbi:hypothetical protein MNB_SUP05-5-63 [hydrothermal vent metagenome]|uniref:DUF3530 family protein n=1 Tax=hydrothermal vent metagenome TaxID=652676 RepID=A0A1W1CAA1_9ZZZZ